jgi:DNA-binding NarL/FixJ family response regulator
MVPGSSGGRLGLTVQQAALVDLLAAGWDNARIADRLGLSPRTVDNQLSRIYKRLGLGGANGVNARVRLVLLYLGQDRAGATGGRPS